MNFDQSTTTITLNNGQGCAQFVGPDVDFEDTRFNHCAIAEAIMVERAFSDDPDPIEPVPLPAAGWAFLTAIGALVGLRARRRRNIAA